MVRTFRALLEFAYLARRNIHDQQSMEELEDALSRFHKYRSIFVTMGVRKEGSTPPRQHSLIHYIKAIRAFGAPNGLCSSITESKHIKAIKEPWRRSNHYNALSQMLLTNQRLDKLAALCSYLAARGMLNGTCLDDFLRRLSKFAASLLCYPLIFFSAESMRRANDDTPGLNSTTNSVLGPNNNNDVTNEDDDGGTVTGSWTPEPIRFAKKAIRTLVGT
jgi:hypothetical protein